MHPLLHVDFSLQYLFLAVLQVVGHGMLEPIGNFENVLC